MPLLPHGIYGCRWKRYQRSHDDTTPVSCAGAAPKDKGGQGAAGLSSVALLLWPSGFSFLLPYRACGSSQIYLSRWQGSRPPCHGCISCWRPRQWGSWVARGALGRVGCSEGGVPLGEQKFSASWRIPMGRQAGRWPEGRVGSWARPSGAWELAGPWAGTRAQSPEPHTPARAGSRCSAGYRKPSSVSGPQARPLHCTSVSWGAVNGSSFFSEGTQFLQGGNGERINGVYLRALLPEKTTFSLPPACLNKEASSPKISQSETGWSDQGRRSEVKHHWATCMWRLEKACPPVCLPSLPVMVGTRGQSAGITQNLGSSPSSGEKQVLLGGHLA